MKERDIVALYDLLQECIDKQKIISIIYSETNNYHQLKPIDLVTANRGKVYLRAINTYFNEERTYLVDKIRSIEETSLKFSSQDILQDNVKFLNNIRRISSKNEVLANEKLNEVIDNKLIKYYSKALKLETLMDIAIDTKKDKIIYIDKNDCIACSLSSNYEKILSSQQNELMKEMIDILTRYPENTIYLGYPYICIKSLLVPVIFQKINYDVDKQSIHIEKGSTVLNYKLFSKDLDLEEDEIEEIKNKILYGNFDELIQDGILTELLANKNLQLNSNKGLLFIEKEQLENIGLLYELKKIAIENRKNELLNGFYNGNVTRTEDNVDTHIYNIVEINDSQKEAVLKSKNNVEIIKGPPGTGKTQTIVNLICNYVLDNKKVLVASQNNKAVDNVLEKLRKDNLFGGALRLGNSQIRDNALVEIQSLLKDINKINDSIEDTDIEISKEKSKIIQREIELIKEKLNETEELTITSEEMRESIESLKKSLVEIELEKYIASYDTDLNELNKNIAIMNKISCLCEGFEKKRNNMIWKMLSKFRFNYDKFRVKQLMNSLNNIKLNLYGNMNFDIILDVKDCADGNIMLMEHNILQNKYNDITKRLEILKNEKWNKRYEEENKNKIDVDRSILKSKYKNMLNDFLISEKETIDILNESDSTVFKKNVEVFKSLIKIYPVILTTNLSVASSIPFEELFDVVIVDEASQCNIPSILPLLVRAKKLVLVGDNKQLPPVITLDEKENQKLIQKFNIDSKYSFKDNSIFDFYNNFMKKEAKVLLKEHFRCNPRIINISNKFFYNSELKIRTKDTDGEFVGLQYCSLRGTIKNGIGGRSISNIEEVNAIKEYLVSNKEYFTNKTIGIITPFKEQKNKLEQMVKNLGGLYENITVGTVHTFQGDEKDIIVLSLVITEGCRDGSVKWINKEKNIINVAITRAKELLYVVGDLSYLSTKTGISKDFSDYLIKYGNKKEVELKEIKEFSIYEILHKQQVSLLNNNNDEIKSIMNSGEKLLYDLLKKIIKSEYKNLEIGIKIRVGDVFNIAPNKIDTDLFYYGLSSHFDFIIFAKNKNLKPMVAIELDGATHSKDKKVIDNDIKKNTICDIYKFPLVRISSKDKISEIKLKSLIHEHVSDSKMR